MPGTSPGMTKRKIFHHRDAKDEKRQTAFLRALRVFVVRIFRGGAAVRFQEAMPAAWARPERSHGFSSVGAPKK